MPAFDPWAEVKILAMDLPDADEGEQLAVVRAWYARIRRDYGGRNAEFAYDVFQIYKARPSVINQEVIMGSSKKVYGDDLGGGQKAGGNITASVAGHGNVLEVGSIEAYRQTVQQCGLDAEMTAALNGGREALQGLSVSKDVMDAILNDYGRLTLELGKPKPDTGLLQKLWGGIVGTAQGVAKIAGLGKLIASKYGIALIGT